MAYAYYRFEVALGWALVITMLFFNSWNWYLAFAGFTSLERMDSKNRPDVNPPMIEP